jgi:hypothetical protein
MLRLEIPDNNTIGMTNKTLRARTFQPLLGKLEIQGAISAGLSLKAEAEIGPIVIRCGPWKVDLASHPPCPGVWP